MHAYREGRRHHAALQEMIAASTEADVVNIAAYFASLPPVAPSPPEPPADPAPAAGPRRLDGQPVSLAPPAKRAAKEADLSRPCIFVGGALKDSSGRHSLRPPPVLGSKTFC